MKYSRQKGNIRVPFIIQILIRFRTIHSVLLFWEENGTLLQAARDVVHKEIPLLGINLGNLGFLAEVNQTSLYSALDQLMADDYEVEERMMLEGRVYRGRKLIGQDIALNDIVIGRDGHLRVVRFKNYVNDVYLNSYNADGIIISTPTGYLPDTVCQQEDLLYRPMPP